MRVGQFGAGRIGVLHASNLVRHERITDLLIFDPITSRAEQLAADVNARAVSSQEEILEEADAIVIASSTDAHADDLVAVAAAAKPAFCEKPIAGSLAATDRAIAAVEAAGIPVLMGFNRRFDAGFRAARQAVEDGTLGTLMLVVGHHHDHRPPPEEYLPVSGGQFKDQLIHDFDLLRFVTGEEVVTVNASGSSIGVPVTAKYDDTAVAAVTLELESGALAMMCGVRTDPVGYDVRMELFGTADSIAVGVDERTPLRSVEAGQPVPKDPYREWLPRFGPSFQAEIDAFVEMAAGEADSPCTVADARAALVIAKACRLALDRDGPVDVKEVT